MRDYSPIGDLIRPIIARAHAMYGFQQMLNSCPDAECRKNLIVAAYENGALDGPDAQLLIEAYQLETA